jgi:hypothetical protein
LSGQGTVVVMLATASSSPAMNDPFRVDVPHIVEHLLDQLRALCLSVVVVRLLIKVVEELAAMAELLEKVNLRVGLVNLLEAHVVGARDGGGYAGNHIVVANRGRRAAVNVGGIVAAVAVNGSSGGFGGDVDTPVLA